MRPFKNAHILLVDDDSSVRRVTRLLLENEGFACWEADGGVEALTLLDGGLRADVIVTDLQMPGINGVSFMKALSYRANGQGIPVILLSGGLNRDVERQVLEGGAYAIFEKPLDFPKFLKALSSALENGLRT